MHTCTVKTIKSTILLPLEDFHWHYHRFLVGCGILICGFILFPTPSSLINDQYWPALLCTSFMTLNRNPILITTDRPTKIVPKTGLVHFHRREILIMNHISQRTFAVFPTILIIILVYTVGGRHNFQGFQPYFLYAKHGFNIHSC